jgi:ribosome maturation factor RimP
LLDGLERLVSPLVEEQGLELVELSVRGPSSRRLLRLDIDRAGPRGIDHDDCKRVSDVVGTALENSEWIPGSYMLEVSSPGVDRPIRSEDDFRRNTGRRIAVTTIEPIDGRRRFVGRLVEFGAGTLRLAETENEELKISAEQVESAVQVVEF